MNRVLRITGLLLTSITISTVALGQQGGGGGGGNGGGGGGNSGGGGDSSVIALRLQDHERARLTRPVQQRRVSPNCVTHACIDQPPSGRRVQLLPRFECGGGDQILLRDRTGLILRDYCETLY